jgi:hypothetical protein
LPKRVVSLGAGFAQLLGYLEKITGRARQAVETVDHHDVLLAHFTLGPGFFDLDELRSPSGA